MIELLKKLKKKHTKCLQKADKYKRLYISVQEQGCFEYCGFKRGVDIKDKHGHVYKISGMHFYKESDVIPAVIHGNRKDGDGYVRHITILNTDKDGIELV